MTTSKQLHPTQKKILKLDKRVDISKLSLRSIGELIGIHNAPQKIKHHMSELNKKGLLEYKGTMNIYHSLLQLKQQAITMQSHVDQIIKYLQIKDEEVNP